MRDPPCPTIGLRIEAFDQSDQVRGLAIPVVPFDVGVRLYRACLSDAIGIDEFDW